VNNEDAMVVYRPLLRLALEQWPAPADECEDGQAAEDVQAAEDGQLAAPAEAQASEDGMDTSVQNVQGGLPLTGCDCTSLFQASVCLRWPAVIRVSRQQSLTATSLGPCVQGHPHVGAGVNVSLDQILQQVHKIIPALDPRPPSGSGDGQQHTPLFDSKFYIMFWALEAPDLCADAGDRYRAMREEMEQEVRKTKAQLRTTIEGFDNYQTAQIQLQNLPLGNRPRVNKPDEQPSVTEADVATAQRAFKQVSSQLAALTGEQEEYVARSQKWRRFIKARAQHVFNAKAKSGPAVHMLMQV
jgi:Transcription factor/nuclear export subunit protein 2